MLNSLPQKKTSGCIGFFWPLSINLHTNFGLSRPMSIDKVNCSSALCAAKGVFLELGFEIGAHAPR
jgi:hypothetical protein